MTRFFAHPPEDDVATQRAAQPVASGYRGRLPDAPELRELTRDRGIDFATAVLYEALRAHPLHGAFAAHLEALPTPREGGGGGAIVVVPGLLWEDYPQLGSDGRLVMDIAQRLGFTAARVPVGGRATLSANARAVVRFLDDFDASGIWLVSLSKGSADLRFAMSGRYGVFPWGKIRGWINICGSPNGSDLAAWLTANRMRKLTARATCLASRIPFQAMEEISSRHPAWLAAPALPSGIQCINVVGLPMRWHLSGMLASRHRALAPQGPNDGVVLCANAYVSPGQIFPLWGYDHYFRGAAAAPLLYRLLAYVREQRATRREHRKFAT